MPTNLLLPVLGGSVLLMLLLVAVVVTITVLCVMYAKWRKFTSISMPREEAIYECVQPVQLEEKMEMKENDAYGYLHADDPRYETISPQLCPHAAPGTSESMQPPVYACPQMPS